MNLVLFVFAMVLGPGCVNTKPTPIVIQAIPATASLIATNTYVIVNLPSPTPKIDNVTLPSLTPTILQTLTPTPTPTCDTLLDYSRILGDGSQFKEAFQILESLTANPDCQTLSESIMEVKAGLFFLYATDALAEQQWDEAIGYFNRSISEESRRYAGSEILIAKNNAPVTGFLDSDRELPKIMLPKGAALNAFGKYLDSTGKAWVLAYAPIFTSSLGIISPEYFSSDTIQSLETITQADPIPELQGHNGLTGMGEAYQGKLQELERIEDYPGLAAAYNTIGSHIWLRSRFPQVEKLIEQALKNSYERGMTLMDRQSPEELEKFFLPIMTSSKDQALVGKARSALQKIYVHKIDSALSAVNATMWGWGNNYCYPGFKRPPLMGMALRPERQKITGWDFKTDSDVEAKSSDEARFIICTYDSYRTVQRASYISTSVDTRRILERRQSLKIIRIKDILTGKQIGQQTLAGSMPRAFQEFETSDVYGDTPDTSSIEAWILSKQLPRQVYEKPEDWLKLASEALQAAQLDLAITGFSAAINLNPTQDTAYWKRGISYLGQNQWEQAIADLEKARELTKDPKTHQEVENILKQHADNPGAVKCWGQDENIPIDVTELDHGVVSLKGSDAGICALTVGGFARCSRDSWQPRFGNFIDIFEYSDNNTSARHTCGLTTIGGVKCWGENDPYVLGIPIGTSLNFREDMIVPMDITAMSSPATTIAMGEKHACALNADGGVKCWGENFPGKLGDGTSWNSGVPVDVVGLGSGVLAITAGKNYTCALVNTGGAKCWGDNRGGQLGDGTNESRNVPADVAGLNSGIVALAASDFYACALTADGGVKCWGRNEDLSTPVDVLGLSRGVSKIFLGGRHACALMLDGAVKCWGSNIFGQLGDGTNEDRNSPVDVVGLSSEVVAVGIGDDFTCALTVEGGVMCWGRNGAGQLGDGTNNDSNTPVDVIGLDGGVVAIASTSGRSCALIKPPQ